MPCSGCHSSYPAPYPLKKMILVVGYFSSGVIESVNLPEVLQLTEIERPVTQDNEVLIGGNNDFHNANSRLSTPYRAAAV